MVETCLLQDCDGNCVFPMLDTLRIVKHTQEAYIVWWYIALPLHRNHYGCSLLFLSESPEVFVLVPYYILGLLHNKYLCRRFRLSIIPFKICSFKSFFLLITILLCRCWKMVSVMMFCYTDFVNNMTKKENTYCDLCSFL